MIKAEGGKTYFARASSLLKQLFTYKLPAPESPEDEPEPHHSIRLIVFIFLFVALWWFIPPVVSRLKGLCSTALQERGQLGDSFGIVSSLFTGIGLAGVVYTLFLQVYQTRLQRRDLKFTKSAREKDEERAESQAKDFGKRLEAMREDQYLTAFNHVYENLTSAFRSLVLEKKISASSVEMNRYTSIETTHGDAAIRLYVVVMRAKATSKGPQGALAALTHYTFDDAALTQYLHLYCIAKELLAQIKAEPLRQVCGSMLDRIHKPTVRQVADSSAFAFSSLDRDLLVSIRSFI